VITAFPKGSAELKILAFGESQKKKEVPGCRAAEHAE
jgi:hypothetical protein